MNSPSDNDVRRENRAEEKRPRTQIIRFKKMTRKQYLGSFLIDVTSEVNLQLQGDDNSGKIISSQIKSYYFKMRVFFQKLSIV